MPEILKDTSVGAKQLPTHARVVVIGGGVVGCSILFHLTKFGWKDVVLLERDELTSGSSWHAAGGIHTISSDPNISRLQSYTINLYKEIEELSGQSVGLHQTGGFYAASTKGWYDYLKGERSKARYMGLDQEFISPRELADRHPLIDRITTMQCYGTHRTGISILQVQPMPLPRPQNSMARSILRIVAQPECHSVPMEAGISRPPKE